MKINTCYLKRYYQRFLQIIFCFAIATLYSCDNTSTPPANPYDYYPLSIGQYAIYQVNEVIYSSGQNDSIVNSFQEKDEVISLTTDVMGNETYTIWRSSRINESGYWQKNKEYKVQRVPDKIIVDLNNETIVPMIFPIDLSLQWNAYLYFNLNDKDYRYGYKSKYQKIGEPLTIKDKNFKNTVKVEERLDTTGLIKYNLAVKYYAEGVGLISEKEADFEYLQNNGELEGYKVIASGKRKDRVIMDYGHN